MKKALFFLLVYLLCLIIFAPARLVLTRLLPDNQPLKLEQISGTLWQGAGYARLEGLELGQISWQLRPGYLFRGQLGASLQAAELNTRAQLAVYPWRPASLQHLLLQGEIPPLARLEPLLAGVEGAFNADMTGIDAASCQEANGDITLNGVKAYGLDAGKIEGILSCTDKGAWQVEFNNQSAPVKLAGSFKLTRQGGYLLDARLQTNDEALREQLTALLGKANAKGQFSLRQTGQL